MQRSPSTDQIRHHLDTDVACQTECCKLWEELEPDERHALLHWKTGNPSEAAAQQSLLERHLVRHVEGTRQPFCRIFAGYPAEGGLAAQSRQNDQHNGKRQWPKQPDQGTIPLPG